MNVVHVFLIVGTLFMLLAAIGLIRMPDLYMRMSAVAKAGTLGASLLVVAIIIEHQSVDIAIRALAVIVFGFLTSPISAHRLSRAAYFQGVPLWWKTSVDELRNRYSGPSHELRSPEEGEEIVAESPVHRER